MDSYIEFGAVLQGDGTAVPLRNYVVEINGHRNEFLNQQEAANDFRSVFILMGAEEDDHSPK